MRTQFPNALAAVVTLSISASLAVGTARPALAQCTPQWVQEFPSGDLNQTVECLLALDQGPGAPALYAGGHFTAAGGASANYIAVWNGTAWSPLGDGMDAGVLALAMFDDDGAGPNPPALYAGGLFLTAGGVAANGVARWDGSSWSPLGSGVDGFGFTQVRALTVYDEDGAGPNPAVLVAGGLFLEAGGVTVNSIATWDGSSWAALGSGVDGGVNDLAVFDADGAGPTPPELYVGGYFTTAGGVGANGIAKWNGTTWSALGGGVSGFGEDVDALAVVDLDGAGAQPEALFVGGSFTSAGGQSAQNIARWDGAAWSALGAGISGSVEAATGFDADGIGSNPPVLVARSHQWNGSTWVLLGAGPNSSVRTFAQFDADGPGSAPPALYAGGSFSSVAFMPAGRIARWDGAAWSRLGQGVDDTVHALAVFDDDAAGPAAPALYAGGEFTYAGNAAANRVAKWDGSSWSPLGSGMQHPSEPYGVYAMATFDQDGAGPNLPALYAAGQFTTAGGASANNIAKWNGSSWSALGSGLNSTGWTLAVFDVDGAGPQLPALYVGGDFTTAGGVAVNRIARWNGTSWSSVGGGANGFVGALEVYDADGAGPGPARLCAGGSFTSIGGVAAQRIATWNGTSWSELGGGVNGSVFDLAVLDDDASGAHPPALFAIGGFDTAGGVSAARIARWNGSAWFGVGGGFTGSSNYPSVLDVLDDDGAGPSLPDLFVGGSFTTVGGGVPADYIARWNLGSWSTLSTGMDFDVEAVVVFDDDGSGPGPSAVYAGGKFGRSGSVSAGRVAKWNGCSSSINGFCFGDGSSASCPCGNNGAPGRGCQNSAGTGGAVLAASGNAGVESDSILLSAGGELPSALTIFLQGNAAIAPVSFGDGLRCTGGSLKRLYVKNASGGNTAAPLGNEAPVSQRSAALGDPFVAGDSRYYQTYYRDANPGFCTPPAGNTFNASSGLSIAWNP